MATFKVFLFRVFFIGALLCLSFVFSGSAFAPPQVIFPLPGRTGSYGMRIGSGSSASETPFSRQDAALKHLDELLLAERTLSTSV